MLTGQVGLQAFVDACWDLCDEGWTFRFHSDQWWALRARCDVHGNFMCESGSDSDLEETLHKLLAKVKAGHEC